MDGVVVGIDLGTTNSLVALYVDGRPQVVPNALGEALTPSVVSIDDDGTTLVGAAAQARLATHPERTVACFKRDMGTGAEYPLAHSKRPEELSALVLRQLKQDAEAHLGQPVREAVITVPAYFGDLQRQATRDAAAIAGLHVERIINEPTAAAMAYGLHEKDREFSAVVLDLGGGTFDVTVIEVLEGVIEVQSSAGDARLGGEDFTDALLEHVESELTRLHGEPGAPAGALSQARLREACERAKRSLTSRDEVHVAVPGLETKAGRVDVDMALSRDDVHEVFAPVVERLRTPILRALRDAQTRPDEIDEVVLVGGATRMAVVSELAVDIFGRLPLRTLPPDEAVALGAAVQAALKADDASVEDVVVTDVAPFTLGIASSRYVGARIVDDLFSPIIERGTVVPCSREERFSTMENNQRAMDIKVYQGEHSHCSRNTLLGSYRLKQLPRGRAGEVSVDVRFTYDLNGLIEVDMQIVGTKRQSSMLIDRNPKQLSKRELDKAREAMQRLKFHPRDTLPNRTALARAEALYAELRGDARMILGTTLSEFRGALETQDPTIIDPCREALVALTTDLRRGR